MVRRSGFTLLELLAVIAIIGVLATLVVAGGTAVRKRAAAAKTATILTTVKGALATLALQTGSIPSPAEHPLLGSRATATSPRLTFVRAAAPNGAVDSTGDAYLVIGFSDADAVSAGGSSALLGTDRFSGGSAGTPRDTSWPLGYGVARSELGVLGGAIPALDLTSVAVSGTSPAMTAHTLSTHTRFRRLTFRDRNDNGLAEASEIAEALAKANTDLELYAPMVRRAAPSATSVSLEDMRKQGFEEANRQIERILAASSAQGDLQALAALRAPRDDDAAHRLLGSRIWSDSAPAARWEAGRIRSGSDWVAYSIPGLMVYDAWGREIFFRIDPTTDNPLLTSAGPDGVLAIHPGSDETYQTDPWDAAIDAADRDGQTDNIRK